MANPYAQQAYKINSLQSLTPGEQVARLLETAAKHILRAKEHASAEQPIARLEATEDAMKIITGLQGCLQYNEMTGNIAQVLNQYYLNLTVQISRINVHNDAAMCDTVCDSLRTMARTWRETEQKARQQQGAGAVAPVPGGVDLEAC